MTFKDVSNKVDFVQLEQEILDLWEETDAFAELQRLRARSEKRWSFLDGPITANNPMGVHHAWGRTYKDLYQRFKAMQGFDQRWQNGFDCQGLWVEVEVEKALGFNSKREIESFGLDNFTKECKMRVLKYAAVQTEQSVRLGYWMEWNDPQALRALRDKLDEDPQQQVTYQGPAGEITGTAEQVVGRLGGPQVGGSYFTFSDENNYQIWGFLKQCYENGWVYKGRDVMPWCSRCGTGISQHEIVTEGYFQVAHDSVFLKFPLLAREKEALLVWTTTPWTLTSNVAAAVGPDLTYVKVLQKEDGWTYYLAEDAMENSLIGNYEVVERLQGQELIGWEFAGPFDELPAVRDAFDEMGYVHRVIPWEEVDASEGTGIVHIAPGCGAEDFVLSKEHQLPVVAPLDENGLYIDGFDWLTERDVHTVAQDIFRELRERGFYYRKQRYEHRYPHCWRCGEELVYRLVDEWFIDTGPLYDKPRREVSEEEKARSLRYQIMDVVDQINWVPSFGYDREMDWLRNMHDWMISKKRYYGLALPIYVCETCDHFHVVGSEEELEERAIEGWEEFEGHSPHRPYIDAVKIACPQCGGQASRIEDVGNPWLDAGIVAYSTLHYREQPQYWEKWFPADFITESFPGQFRNWFYSLLAQSTALTGRPPFRNIFGYALLMGEDGREMHKSWGNAIEFNEAADEMGADTMRWLFAAHKPEQNLLFGYKLADETRRRFLIPLWNVYSFLVTYAKIDEWKPQSVGRRSAGGVWQVDTETLLADVQSSDQANAQLDQWIVERLNETILEMTEQLEVFRADGATVVAEAFLDDLSNWYVRRSRRRFWKSEADDDKAAAYATLYHVLVTLARLLAPFIPFTAEAMYQNLVRGADSEALTSVHHTLWPETDGQALDRELLDKMRLGITVASLGRAARSSVDIKLRQPLSSARVNVATEQEKADIIELTNVLAEEINVKEIEVVSEVGELVNYKILPNNRLLGPKYGADFPRVRQALTELDPAQAVDTLQKTGQLTLSVDGESITLDEEEVLVQTESRGGLAVASDKGVTVAVDTELTPALVQEGHARDLVRTVNNMRKEAGLEIEDRIHLQYEPPADDEVAAALENFAGYVKQETLAVTLQASESAQGDYAEAVAINDTQFTVALQKAD